MTTYKRVHPIQSDGDWYVIPFESKEQFIKDEQDQDLIDSGEFAHRWDEYRLGGCLSLAELYMVETLSEDICI